MNLSPILGFLLAIGLLWKTVIHPSPNPAALFEINGFLLVVGGTLAAGLVIFPISQLIELYKFVLFGVVLKKTPQVKNLAKDIVSASFLRADEHHLFRYCGSSHPFLSEGFELLAEGQLEEKDLRDVLTRRSQYFKNSYLNDAKMLAILAKFPSSFGMLGSTVGLIDMMSTLGRNGTDGIGPAMAMALVTTFWGLVFTYMILTPLSDYALRLNNEDSTIRQLIVEGLLMIKRNEDPHVVLDKINGFLALDQRLAFKNAQVDKESWEHFSQEVEEIRRQNAA